MYRRAFAILISVAVAAAIAVGCGGDEESSAASPTKSEFVKQADTLCKGLYKDVQKQLAAAARALRANPVGEQKQELLLVNTIIIPTLQKQHDELEKLGVPEDDEGQVEEILDALVKLIEEAEANPVGTLAKGDPFLEVDQRMKAYGIEACRH